MKKTILVPFVMLGLLFAGSVNAADNTTTAFQGGNTLVPDTDCSLLAQRATITASANVHAAYHCATASNTAYAGACHTGGSANPRTVTCSCTDVDGTQTPNNSQCSCDVNGNATPATVETTGRQAFGGSSKGGIVASYDIGGDGTCSATSIVAIDLFP